MGLEPISAWSKRTGLTTNETVQTKVLTKLRPFHNCVQKQISLRQTGNNVEFRRFLCIQGVPEIMAQTSELIIYLKSRNRFLLKKFRNIVVSEQYTLQVSAVSSQMMSYKVKLLTTILLYRDQIKPDMAFSFQAVYVWKSLPAQPSPAQLKLTHNKTRFYRLLKIHILDY